MSQLKKIRLWTVLLATRLKLHVSVSRYTAAIRVRRNGSLDSTVNTAMKIGCVLQNKPTGGARSCLCGLTQLMDV